jgi:hypothetical protein
MCTHAPCAGLPDASEFAFNTTSIPESGLLEAAESNNATWSGFILHDKTNPLGPLADKLLCNGTHDLTPASTIQGDLSVVLVPTEGISNASAVIDRPDPGSAIRLNSMWIVSLKVRHVSLSSRTLSPASSSRAQGSQHAQPDRPARLSQ